MFKKSIWILAVCVIVIMAAILAYVALRGHTPWDTMRDAEVMLAQGQYAQVISELNQAENSYSVKQSAKLQLKLWRIRAQAHANLGNAKGALKDVRQLLANGFEQDIDLRLDEIRYLATDGQGEMARIKARKFLADHPEHPRGLELAGEACQTAYKPLLQALRDLFERELGTTQREQANQALLTYLFRPADDPLVERARVRLEALFGSDPRLQQLWPQLWSDIDALKQRVSEALGYFQQSLDLGGETVAAFRAIATSLEQSGRIDDLLVACEIQRRMFQHVYVAESGALAAWVRLEAGLPQAAVATTERWLPIDEITERAANGLLTATTDQIVLARTLAAWRQHDRKQIKAAKDLINSLRSIDRQVALALHLSFATQRLEQGDKDFEQVESSLSRVVNAAITEPAQPGRPDFVAEFAPLWIDALIAKNAPEVEINQALSKWRNGRPEAIEPRLRTAEYLFDIGSIPAALAAITAAAKIDPEHPEVFPLHLKIARLQNETGNQSGASLLDQCIKNRKALPEAREPIGFVLCAEAALALNEPRLARIALACARNAIGSFPWANIPRQLELRALLQQRQYEEAARTAQVTLSAITPNAATLAIAMEAMKLAQQPVRELIRMSLPIIQKSDTESGRLMQVELLRLALADAPATSDRFVTKALLGKDATIEQRVLAIHAFLGSDNGSRAFAQLRALQASEDPVEQELTAGALAAFLLAKAESAPDAELLKILQNHRQRLKLDRGPQLALLNAARQLAEDHPLTAYDLLNHSLPSALAEERNGPLYVLAGELALKHRDAVRATDYWMAAMGFEDGAQIAERLSRLLLITGDPLTANRIGQLTQTPTDPAMSARFGYATIAANLCGELLKQEPSDLLTHAALSLFGAAPLLDWKPPTDDEQREARINLIAGLRDPLLGWLCVPLAEDILKATPRSLTSMLLLARAKADAGDTAGANQLHTTIFKRGYINIVMWREAAYAGRDPAYVPDPGLAKFIMDASLGNATGNSQLAAEYGATLIVRGFELGGFPDMAKKTLLLQWQTRPHLRPCTPEAIELITTGMTPINACTTLDKILRGPHPGDRAAVLTAFYDLAEKLVAADKKHAQLLTLLASAHAISDGAQGRIVHFLRDNPIKSLQLPIGKLLREHLERIATGRDDQSYLAKTMTALIDQQGLGKTTEYIDELLAKYPTSIPFWSVRASLKYRQEGDPQGLAELRTVLTHALDAPASLRFLGLVAAARRMLPEDLAMWRKLPKDLVASPEGAYVNGLIALRQGEPEKALEFLQTAAPQHDGRHLFDMALAYLESPDPDGVAKAKAMFERLLADYPKSSLAQNAGSFVRQLTERP